MKTNNVDFLDDEWGGIDKEIKACVFALNRIGIPTIGSCAGHADSKGFFPYIDISSDTTEDGSEDEEVTLAQTAKLRLKVKSLLSNFYTSRETNEQSKIEIADYGIMFDIHNGGSLWKRWRAQVEEAVQEKNEGRHIPSAPLTEDEIHFQEEILASLQKEFSDFASYLSRLEK